MLNVSNGEVICKPPKKSSTNNKIFFLKVNSKTPFYNKKMFLKEEPAFLSQLRLRDFQSPESSLSPNPSLQVPVVIKSNLWQY